MAYIKYKELTKFFNFSRYIKNDELAYYITDYAYEDERILATYKTFRDHGMFTTEKMVLFDNRLSIRPYKKIYTIPYNRVSSLCILFRSSVVELQLDLDNGYQLRLKFVNMTDVDKVRLRLLYSYISRVVTRQKIPEDLIQNLMDNNIVLRGGIKWKKKPKTF